MAQIRERGIYNFATPRRRGAALSWHLRNEFRNLGYIDQQPQYSVRPFRIGRWLNPDGGPCPYRYNKEEPVRYSELDEQDEASWEKRMRPWEEDRMGCTGLENFGYTRKAAMDEAERRMLGAVESRRYDRVYAAFPPFGGRPMVLGLKNNKVTIL